MVATIAKAATADYYIHSQASFRTPGEYYLSGEEPDGVWWNPSALFASQELDIAHGETVDSADFYRLYRGLDPRTGEKLTRNADSEKRCPAYDITFNADKTVSALWAIAPAELRAEIEKAHNDAVKIALEDVIKANCSYTRIQEDKRGIKVVPANIMAALFQHGASRSNDPHLHTHCVILNLAKAHHDGKWRALHGHPLYSWQKAAGATYRAELAYLLRDRFGIEMEVHGQEQQYTRIKDTPESLVKDWSKRDIQINDTAARFGVSLQGNGALHGAIQRLTRSAKEHGLDPEHRHQDWVDEASEHIQDIPAFLESLTGKELEFTEEDKLDIAAKLADIPAQLTKHESVFYYTDLVERAANAASGLLSREQRQRTFDKVLQAEEIVELDKPDTSHDAGTRLNSTRPFTARHTIETERNIHALATELLRTGRFEIPPEARTAKVRELKAADYPIDGEQIRAIEAATRAGQIAIIEGAAGSGKTTTLRPIADLYKDQGYDIIATSVSWRITLELGSDLDAPNWCVDKLNAGMVSGRIAVSPRTVIVVDEAGQLSSLQAAQILRMAQASGAKVIFAGDTQQQQPVEAGPGLRLISDVTGSVRVDTIRRQKADIEDILVAIHGENREAAQLRAEIAPALEKQRILDEFDAIPDAEKAKVRPWQVAASEHFRDGDAAQGIAAYNSRGRLHIDSNLDKTFTHLIADWDRLRTEQPNKTSAVIAYSRAEVNTLSHLMRERLLTDYQGPRYTVQACRSREPKAKPESLELAVGDIIRTGAANFDKQLFNGTHLRVLELREDEPTLADPGVPRIWIKGRTDRGKIVEFHHDQIRDYHGKIRLDYGYAMTMNAAQGLTVDRAFVFANQKPSRETVYPAMTRHRERLDVYVDRKPVELDVRHQRSEDIAGDPVTDKEILDYLARNWSRSKQKEAAQDYMSEHMRDRYIHPERTVGATADVAAHRATEPATAQDAAMETPPAHHRIDAEGLGAPQWLAANDAGDGKLSEIAAQIRYSEIQVKHGLAAKTLGLACRKLNSSLAEWDEARLATGNAAVAMDPQFKQHLKEASAILRTVKPFLQDDPLHARVLREHGGIEISDLETLASSHKRALSIRTMSIDSRRRLDPDFTAATPPMTRESVAAKEISNAFQALEPETQLHTVDTATAPPADLWEGWEQRHGETQLEAGAEYDEDPAYDWEIGSGEIPHYEDLEATDIAHEWPRGLDPAATPEPDAAGDRALAAAERIAFFEQSYDRHCKEARAAGQHPFLASGWPELHREMREIAALPDIAPDSRATFARSVQIADNWLSRDAEHTAAPREHDTSASPDPAAAPNPAELIEEHRNRLARHCGSAAAAGLHPFDAPGWDGLEQELRSFLDLPDVSRGDRSYLQEQIADIDAARRSLAAADAQARTREQQPTDRTAEHLYLEHKQRHDAYIQSVLHADQPPEIDITEFNKLRGEGLALLQMPGLSTAARNDLAHTYDPKRHFEILAMQMDKRREFAIRGNSPYQRFDRLFGKHLDAAAARELHPYAAPGWPELAEKAHELMFDNSLTEHQREALGKVLTHYNTWSEARRQVSRTHEQDQSRGISF